MTFSAFFGLPQAPGGLWETSSDLWAPLEAPRDFWSPLGEGEEEREDEEEDDGSVARGPCETNVKSWWRASVAGESADAHILELVEEMRTA